MTDKKHRFLFFTLIFSFFLFLLIDSTRAPIGDFGNYYYGSKLFHEKGNAAMLYEDIHTFNEQIKSYGENGYFENYIPVPPFSLIFYYPLVFLKSVYAKLLFNLFSILFFAFSLTRFIEKEFSIQYKYLLSLLILCMPFYNNVMQGQAYIFLSAVVLEIYMAYRKGNYFLPGCLLAVIFQLKLFPIFLVFYFIVKKEFKVVAWFILISGILILSTLVVVGKDVMASYYFEIIPRLLSNEIIDPYYYGHQSTSILLKNLLAPDALRNPSPFFDLPLLAVILGSAIAGFVVYYNFLIIRKDSGPAAYGFTLLCLVLLTNYVTSYLLALLIPFVLILLKNKNTFVLLLLLTVICNVPLSAVDEMPFIIKYFRITGFFLVFFIYITQHKPKQSYAWLTGIVLLFVVISASTYRETPGYYLQKHAERGVYYHMEFKNKIVYLKRCLGDIDFVDSLVLPVQVESARPLNSHPLLKSKYVRVKDIFLINNSALVYLSDMAQGVGMYQPRIQITR